MVKYQNRGQGTLAAILWVVAFFLLLDLLITILMLTGVNISEVFKQDLTNQTMITDNSIRTDNTTNYISTDNQ